MSSCCLLATILTTPPVEAAETTVNKAYVLGAKQALDVIASSIADEKDSANVKKTYADIEFVLTSYRLKDRLPLLAGETTTLDHQMCVNEYATKTIDNLVTISEYFSMIAFNMPISRSLDSSDDCSSTRELGPRGTAGVPLLHRRNTGLEE